MENILLYKLVNNQLIRSKHTHYLLLLRKIYQ